MPVYLSTATLGNAQTLLTLGQSGELMAWFYPHKDASQHINQCLPCVYLGHGGQGKLHWTFDAAFSHHQSYIPGSNALETVVEGLGLKITFTDVVPDELPVLVRQIRVENVSGEWKNGGFYHYGDWNMDGIPTGNGVVYSRGSGILVQNHRETALAIGGDALQGWQCGKAGDNWAHNAKAALERGVLQCQDLEIGDVDWAFGFYAELEPGQSIEKTAIFALGRGQQEALAHFHKARATDFATHLQNRLQSDQAWLQTGLQTLGEGASRLPEDLKQGFERSLLCLPLLCGEEGAAVAAPEFDPNFESCGGYGYLWPRDGGEYVSGLLDAGYPDFSTRFFDWCAKHQDESGLWHQRYHLNGEVGPNWCLPPDMLQIDQVGAVLWAYGKWFESQLSHKKSPLDESFERLRAEVAQAANLPTEMVARVGQAALAKLQGQSAKPTIEGMIRRAADYLIGRQDEVTGVHKNAFDTWETFVGSFTYSNAAIYAAFRTAHAVLSDAKYDEAAQKMKNGILQHFVREAPDGYRYLTRGFKADGSADETVDSASLGAIEPFGLLDLDVPAELELAQGTLRAVTEKLEVDWMGARAIRRFEGDAYVGGVPACVNTLWMARCCLHVAQKTGELELVERAESYLQVVLRRATPTGLLPELMQGPTGQTYWAAPHGWAMASFVSGVLKLAELKK